MQKNLEAIDLYKRGVKVAHIAIIVNVTKSTVYAWLKKAGIKIKGGTDDRNKTKKI